MVPALQWQARHFSKRSGIPVSVQAEGSFQDLSEDLRICVYRIVQETLTNCAKHSNAHRVDVSLGMSDDVLEVVLHDDGNGFDTRSARRQGLGLIGIEERVRELGGSLLIESEPGKGSTFRVRLGLVQRSVA